MRLQTLSQKKDQRVRRRFRLTSSNDLKRVRRFGKSYAHPLIVLIALPQEQEKSRFAVSAGRSVGNAVQRNRAKRLIREALRASVPEILSGWDIVILARKPIVGAHLDQIRSALDLLLVKANLLRETQDG